LSTGAAGRQGDLLIAERGRLRPPALIVHGGAGLRRAEELDDEHRRGFDAAVRRALAVGWHALERGGDAVAVAVEAVAALEDSGVMNAGRGSVRTSEGTVEMDAAVMGGAARTLGAVAGVAAVRNPVRAARYVLDDGNWAFLAGPAADRYAIGAGGEPAPPGWFRPTAGAAAANAPASDTVGAVVVDGRGHTAAATSTGGVPGQVPGRIGDSPVAGAGLWADDRSCAVSATGTGEVFLRAAPAHHVHLLLRAGSHGEPASELLDACGAALDEVVALGGHGGLIALTPAGDYALAATTPLMIRGFLSADHPATVRLFAGA
jgi:beta-aspartyl-peptidase (threonine type)